MVGIQILAVLFALFMMYILFLHKKRKEFTMKESVFWLILWLAFIFLAVWPDFLNPLITGVIKMKRPLDFYIILGFMFLTGALFYSYTLIRKNQKRIEDLVTKIAIDKAEKKE